LARACRISRSTSPALIRQHPVGWQELCLQQRLEEGLVQRRHRVPFLSSAISLLQAPICCKPTAVGYGLEFAQ
jgi:hypothetical protein